MRGVPLFLFCRSGPQNHHECWSKLHVVGLLCSVFFSGSVKILVYLFCNLTLDGIANTLSADSLLSDGRQHCHCGREH